MAHLLVIDDDDAVTGIFVRMLQADGHDVRASTGVDEGLRQINERRPDAVILDMRMPVAGGLDFLRALRAEPAGAGLPVAVVTGDYFVKDAILRELDGLGAIVRYKPLWMTDMSALVERLLGPVTTRITSSARTT